MEADDPQCSDIRVEAPCEEKVSCQAAAKQSLVQTEENNQKWSRGKKAASSNNQKLGGS